MMPARLAGAPRHSLIVLVACAAAAALGGAPRRAAAQTGALAGRVLDHEASAPLPYSGVSIVGRSTQRLTNDDGRFQIPDIAPGTIHLRIRRVGYSQVDTDVVIQPNATTELTVRLTHIAVRLAAVQVTDEACTRPGAPSVANANIAAVFEQLTLNAEQFRLVSTQYPFTSVFDRYYGRLIESPPARADSLGAKFDTAEVFTRSDTVVIRSDRPWKYKPGQVVVSAGFSAQGVRYGVEIPTLAVFADPTFIKNHCFDDAGEVSLEGQRLRRIDFHASAKIRDPDLDGTIYLDPTSFVIRRSEISLSRPSEHAKSFASISVETFFDELVPGVPIITRTNGQNTRTTEASLDASRDMEKGRLVLADLEQQRARSLRFQRTAPTGIRQSIHLSRILGVFDAENGDAMAGVTVRDSATGKAVLTSMTGTVGLTFIPRQSAVVIVEHQGYERQVMPVSLTLRDSVPITVVLQPIKAVRPPSPNLR
ncbi:MAG TPA: carboxypeptidase regulatory-like domain-containing protein [Gemmatimonadaceae bacterium]|nr:carboxypeptidase regulatory-like domain-containing protein [Gemmatimonadaceae bacterium]